MSEQDDLRRADTASEIQEDPTHQDVDRLSLEEQNRREEILRNYRSSKATYDTDRPAGWTESPGIRAIGGIVGEGHHSTVYSVTLENGERAVLKVDGRDLVNRFQEVREKVLTLRSIHHPNISELIGFVPGIRKDRSYILMEYVPGETLEKLYNDRLVAEQGDLFPWWRVIRWGDQILSALEYLHGKGLVHGDIRLSNIMFRPKRRDADEEHEICLVDFNWAAPDRKPAADTASDEEKSNTFRTVGDDEQFRRGIQRDIYYTGMVMFQLLTGELPDPHEARKDFGNKQKGYPEKLKREALMRHGVERGLADVIVKSLAILHDDRYSSAEEMRSALKGFLDKAPPPDRDGSGSVFKDYEAAKKERSLVSGIPTDETINIRVGQLGGIIGQGRHSTVYLGELAGSGKKIALKKDHRNLMNDFPEIWRKVQALGKIRNEHISRLMEFVPDYKKNCSYIVMEYVPGPTLRDTLTYIKGTKGTFSQDRTLTIALQILDALETLHGSGVVHGDINLSNMILRPKKKEDEDDDICLIDFNLSAPDGVAGEVVHEINAPDAPDGMMAPVVNPEAFRRGVLRDIYHVGAVMYQLLTGEVPDSGTDKKEAVEREKAEPTQKKWQKLKDRGVSDAVAEVIQKAISFNPNNRYASAEEMREALLETPAKEKPESRKRISVLRGVAAALVVAGTLILSLGLFQTREMKLMRLAAQDAEKALYAGDYTAALREVAAAAGSGSLLEPPAPAEAQRILANVLGVYQFDDGYRPWYSIPTAEYGNPVFARISPNGTRLAVLFRQSEGDAVIQMWDTETGRALHRLETDGVLGSFAFLDNEHLIYANGGQLICESFESGGVSWKTEPRTNQGPVCLALSGAGNKAAVMFENDSSVYLCNTVNITSGDTIPFEKITLDGALKNLSERLFALNEDGSCLAVSFSGSDLAVYDIEDGTAVRRENISLRDSGYTNFEGGFYEGLNYDNGSQKKVSRFFYSAFMEDETGYVSEYYRYNLDGTDAPGDLGAARLYEPIYTRVDRGGMYRTEGSTFFRVPTEQEAFGRLGEVNQPINLLEHYFSETQNDGRILLGTATRMQVRSEDGKNILLSIPLSEKDISYDRGCISGNYVALISSRGSQISVLKWLPGEARASYGYPVLPENTDVRRTVRSDRGAVVLYDETGYAVCENGSAGSPAWTEYADYGGKTLEVQYERQSGGDCIKVIRENGILYCSVQGDGASEEAADENPAAQTYAGRFQSLLEDNTIRNIVKNQEILSISASPDSDWTLVSLRGMNMEGRTILLDRTRGTIAEIPFVCDALDDGTLFADNGSGVIAEASIASLADMREEAQTREGRLGFA